MELKRAKEVLEGMDLEVFTAGSISATGEYLYVKAGDETSIIDGHFTADELEAIATWMRDPEGVVGA